jgi:hypothetical protein
LHWQPDQKNIAAATDRLLVSEAELQNEANFDQDARSGYGGLPYRRPHLGRLKRHLPQYFYKTTDPTEDYKV